MSSQKVAQSIQNSETLRLFRDLKDAELASINGGLQRPVFVNPNDPTIPLETPLFINPQNEKLGLTITIPYKINKNTVIPL